MAAFRHIVTSISSTCGNNVGPTEETLDWRSDEGNAQSSVAEKSAESDEESEKESDFVGSILVTRKRCQIGLKTVVSCTEEKDLQTDLYKPVSKNQQEAPKETILPVKRDKGKSGPMFFSLIVHAKVD